MKKVIIIGAGGFASECFTYIKDCVCDSPFIFKGFLSTENNLMHYGLSDLYLGHYDDYLFEDDDYVVIAIGDPESRQKIYYSLKNRSIKFFTLISNKAAVTNLKNIGEGTIIANFSTIAPNVEIGPCNIINSYCGIGHDTVIGGFNTFSSFSDICGYVRIGELNFFTSRCTVLPHARVGDKNKVLPASVIYKKCSSNLIVSGNPALTLCKQGEL